MSSYKYLGKDFYYKLDNDKVINMITIQRTDVRSFTYFTSYDSFISWYLTVPVHLRCFDEVIIGARKFIIDLDCNDVSNIDIDKWNVIIDIYVKQMTKLLNSYDILIYNSNGKNKLSSHIISTNIYTSDNINAYNIAREIYENVDQEYRIYMDLSIYKNVQFMRIEGSRKANSNRYLYLRYNNSIYDLKLSMLRNITGCALKMCNKSYNRNTNIGYISNDF